MLKQSASTT